MKPVLTFFFDALKPESIKHMPFLATFPETRRIRSEFGYSVTCHPSMYSGVHPNKHLQWFIWKYSPETSPFPWAKIFKHLSLLDNLPSRYFLHRYTRQFRKENTAWFGVPLLVNLPLKYWPFFDVVEDRSWDEPGYLKEYPTIFDILRTNQIDFEVVGMERGGGDEFTQLNNHKFDGIKPWTYFFLGRVDSFSHKYGQDSPETINLMRQFDQLVEKKFNDYSKKVSDFDIFMFSDHGHIPVKKIVDIHSHFIKHGHNLKEYIHIIDANVARFWFRSGKERREIEQILNDLPEGFILTDDHFKQYHVDMPDNRYGDLIYYLDVPSVFSKTVWGFNRNNASMHGYLPDYPDSDGVFISQRKLVDQSHVALVDILPTILDSLGVDIPAYVDGQVLWKD